MNQLKIFFRKLKSILKRKSEEMTYEEFIRLEGKKFRGQKVPERPQDLYIYRRDI